MFMSKNITKSSKISDNNSTEKNAARSGMGYVENIFSIFGVILLKKFQTNPSFTVWSMKNNWTSRIL